MRPLIGLSVLLVMLVGSTSIIRSTHSLSEPMIPKVRRYLQQPPIGMPTSVNQQSAPAQTEDVEPERVGPGDSVNPPNPAYSSDAPPPPEVEAAAPAPSAQPEQPQQQPDQPQQQPEQPPQQQEQQEQHQQQQQPSTAVGEAQNPTVPKPASTGRGLGLTPSPDQAVLANYQPAPPPPKIIEKGSEVVLPQQDPNYGQIMPANQVPQLQNIPTYVNQTPPIDTSLLSTNQTLAPSSARTYGFDGWTSCSGDTSGKSGVCKNDVDCRKVKGRPEGSCMGGLGVCCVIALSCGDKSSENNTFFANPDFPDSSWDARLCEVEVKKKSKNIAQVLIEFEYFELALPDYEGECVTDIFQVKLASNRYSPYSNVRLCGMNTGQHLYLDVSQVDDPIVLSVATSGSNYGRRWSIKIIQMDEKNYLQAPPGCLQYYTDTTGIVRSFNLGKNLRGLYYAICFRIDNGYSGIRFTDNYFGMSSGECSTPSRPGLIRKKIHLNPHYQTGQSTQYHVSQQPGGYQSTAPPQGAYNHPYNPHHLVLAPPGHIPHLPPPGYTPAPAYGVPTMRYKRHVESRLSLKRERRQVSLDLNGQPMKRSFLWGSEPSKEEENKNKGENYTTHGYNQGYSPYPGDYPGHMKFVHEGNKHHGAHHQLYPSTNGPYGTTLTPYGPQYPQTGYHQSTPNPYASTRYPTYGPQYTPSAGHHEALKIAGHQGGHMKHHHGMDHPGYRPYGQQPYGPQQAYPYGYAHAGGAYHKEIDKFGKKYEEMYYQNEKNHKSKEDKYYENNYQHYDYGKKDQKKDDKKGKKEKERHHEVVFPEIELIEPPHCEPRSCSNSDVITFPPSFGSTAEMCGNQFNRGRGSVVVSGSPLVVYVNSRGKNRGSGFDLYYEQVFALPHQHY